MDRATAAAIAADTLDAAALVGASEAPAVNELRASLARYHAAVENHAAAVAIAADRAAAHQAARETWAEVQTDAAWSKVDKAKLLADAAAAKASALALTVDREGEALAAALRGALAAERAATAEHYARTCGPLLNEAVRLALSLDGIGVELTDAVNAHNARVGELFRRLVAAGELEASSALAPPDVRAKLSGLDLVRVAFGEAARERPREVPSRIGHMIAADRQKTGGRLERPVIEAAAAASDLTPNRRPLPSTWDVPAPREKEGPSAAP